MYITDHGKVDRLKLESARSGTSDLWQGPRGCWITGEQSHLDQILYRTSYVEQPRRGLSSWDEANGKEAADEKQTLGGHAEERRTCREQLQGPTAPGARPEEFLSL